MPRRIYIQAHHDGPDEHNQTEICRSQIRQTISQISSTASPEHQDRPKRGAIEADVGNIRLWAALGERMADASRLF